MLIIVMNINPAILIRVEGSSEKWLRLYVCRGIAQASAIADAYRVSSNQAIEINATSSNRYSCSTHTLTEVVGENHGCPRSCVAPPSSAMMVRSPVY